MQKLQGLTNRVRTAVRAERPTETPAGVSGKDHPRKGLLRNADKRVALVVSKQCVIRRAMLFDEVALKDQRFEFAVHHDPLKVADLRNHSVNSVGMVCAFSKVRPNSGAQIDRLTNVKDLACFIAVDVAAGLGRQAFELFRDLFGRLPVGH